MFYPRDSPNSQILHAEVEICNKMDQLTSSPCTHMSFSWISALNIQDRWTFVTWNILSYNALLVHITV